MISIIKLVNYHVVICTFPPCELKPKLRELLRKSSDHGNGGTSGVLDLSRYYKISNPQCNAIVTFINNHCFAYILYNIYSQKECQEILNEEYPNEHTYFNQFSSNFTF